MSERGPGPRDFAPGVRAMYEEYSFPNRDPADERHRLVVAEIDTLAKLNHFCFAGRQRFDGGFRALVAGGGTGDHTIFLAEQLRGRDASVTYLDVSRASMDKAMARAAARGLDNVEWHHASILDLPELDLAPFDLVSCTGVLHHLPDPAAGLAALRAVLKDTGAMSLMLYGRAGRMGVYAGQELMRLLNTGVERPADRVRNARSALASLPPTHWLMRGGERRMVLAPLLDDDANLYDTLLHPQDRAYDAVEIHELLGGADLELVEFTFFVSEVPTYRYLYDPNVWIGDPALRDHVARLPLPVRQAIAEAMCCMITCHAFYAAPRAAGRVAVPDADMVPGFLYFEPAGLAERMRAARGNELAIAHRHSTVRFVPGPFSGDLLGAIDGSRTLGQLFAHVREEHGAAASDGALMRDFMAFYEPLNMLDALLLRHRSVPRLAQYPLRA
ncbi:MAG: class I SAM-dependent methyltransferase [Gammaproteobacteria bacterium]|nr:class I SAM-dependent methyltransferase [Gammaproteobacteria bacterium]